MSCADRPRCACGKEIRCPNDDRCEDCFADAQERWPGKSQRVNTTSRPELYSTTEVNK